MKNIVISFLLIFYVVSATGFSIKVHYCGGEFSSLSFNLKNDFCGKCGKKSMKGCCSDKTLSYKLEADQQIDQVQIKINKASLVLFDIQLLKSAFVKYFYATGFSAQLVEIPPLWLKTKFIFFIRTLLI